MPTPRSTAVKSKIGGGRRDSFRPLDVKPLSRCGSFTCCASPITWRVRSRAGSGRSWRTFYENNDCHVVPGAIGKADVGVYVRSFSRPGRKAAGYDLYRSFEEDVRDNDEFAKTPLEMPVLAVGARKGAGKLIADATKATAKNVVPRRHGTDRAIHSRRASARPSRLAGRVCARQSDRSRMAAECKIDSAISHSLHNKKATASPERIGTRGKRRDIRRSREVR